MRHGVEGSSTRAWTPSLAVVLAITVWAPSLASARPEYVDRVPNTDVEGCYTCHNNASGGLGCASPPCLNSFGSDFLAAGLQWTSWLRQRDSDGDRRANGRELVYHSNSFPGGTQGPNSYVTHPGYSSSRHTDECWLQGRYGSTTSYLSNYTNCSTSSGVICTNNTFSSIPSNTQYFGFRCSCAAGYTGNGRRDVPSDGVSDSGATGCTPFQCTGNPCSPGTCNELSPPSTYSCSCPSGYVASGGGCVINNPCAANTDDCDPNATCTPVGTTSWNCACNFGFRGIGSTFRGTGDDCEDIDECVGNPCAPGSCSEEDPGFYSCECPDGYEVYTPPRGSPTCRDIDECRTGLADCDVNATCANTAGSFTCTCNPGYEGPGWTCMNVDECLVEMPCVENATCRDTEGSYVCACAEGYIGDGAIACTDYDDCPGIACGPHEVCLNQIGAPGLCECEAGYYRESETAPCYGECGDGIRVLGEECDDANTDEGDGCDARCEIEPGYACFEDDAGTSACEATCGDGLIQRFAGEECDRGADVNSDTEPDACRESCREAFCGDGVVDTGEACDDGEMELSDEAPDACRTNCQPARCGDGVVDTGELCDEGEGTDCDAPCATPDAGVMVDAGTGEPMDGGCSCRAAPRPGRSLGGLAVVGVAVAVSWRRRRRRG